jgi:ABC-type multidrug transport system fused ATPase/permease subunit
VGQGGSRLSAAQRQRVTLARALLKRPQILILDGALGPLESDKRTEMHQRLIAAMKGRTLIAVLERLDVARFYDRVVVLDAGKVEEMGTYAELTSREGLFHKLVGQAGRITA